MCQRTRTARATVSQWFQLLEPLSVRIKLDCSRSSRAVTGVTFSGSKGSICDINGDRVTQYKTVKIRYLSVFVF
jgi:uncharacterized protein YaeQ